MSDAVIQMDAAAQNPQMEIRQLGAEELRHLDIRSRRHHSRFLAQHGTDRRGVL